MFLGPGVKLALLRKNGIIGWKIILYKLEEKRCLDIGRFIHLENTKRIHPIKIFIYIHLLINLIQLLELFN